MVGQILGIVLGLFFFAVMIGSLLGISSWIGLLVLMGIIAVVIWFFLRHKDKPHEQPLNWPENP